MRPGLLWFLGNSTMLVAHQTHVNIRATSSSPLGVMFSTLQKIIEHPTIKAYRLSFARNPLFEFVVASSAQKDYGAFPEVSTRKNVVLTSGARVCRAWNVQIGTLTLGTTVGTLAVLPSSLTITQDVNSPSLACFWHPERIVGLCPPFFFKSCLS